VGSIHQCIISIRRFWISISICLGDFARQTVAYGFCTLALIDINRLKSLSKGWRQTATGLEFRQARIDGGSFATRLYDMQTNSWHSFVMHIFLGIHFEMMFASNGGLKCSVSTSNNKSPKPEDDQLLMVCNPLTRDWKSLPRRPLVTNLPMMIQQYEILQSDCSGSQGIPRRSYCRCLQFSNWRMVYPEFSF
jgi:hypothetical protein